MSRRVLFFMSTGSPIGGVETWLERICVGLTKEGWEPIVGLAWGLQTHQPERFRKFHPDLEAINVDGRGLPQSSRVQACLRTIRRIRPDVVLPLGLVDAVPACGLAKLQNAQLRVIARTQGLLAPMLADLEDYRTVFDMAVCPGRLNARYLTSVAGFEASRVRHVPNAADLPVRDRQSRVAKAPLRLAYVGRLTDADKRVMDLVPVTQELIQRSVPFELKIVGDGPCRGQLESLLGSTQQVTFTGALPHAEVCEHIYPKIDCLLSFSSSESFGISVVEAMMNGVVPVTSQFLGLLSEAAVIHDETGMVFPIGDAAMAADHLAQLSGDESKLACISAAAAESARRRYSWEACLQGWKTCLTEVGELAATRPDERQFARVGGPAGRLDRLGVPAGMIDAFRRLRRSIAPVVKAGGEEWPLYRRHHSPQRLAEIATACGRLDQAAATAQVAIA
jgi:glycosyltransferase involved in cell wall biosynthesis